MQNFTKTVTACNLYFVSNSHYNETETAQVLCSIPLIATYTTIMQQIKLLIWL
jgi:hypothetical protein